MLAIGYIRVSTDQQVESGLGLEAQKKAINELATKMGASSLEFFGDEGLSGALALEKRPGIVQALSALNKDAVLIVAKRDRLGRDPLVLAMIESAVKRKGARIISCAGEGTENDDPSSIFMRRLVDAFGEYERLIIGARVKAALGIKKDKGERVGYVPFGCTLQEDGKTLAPCEDELLLLNHIAALRTQQYSIRKIAAALNKEHKFNRGGSPWNHASVHRMLNKIALMHTC
jgi:site-specific DNA recombinase